MRSRPASVTTMRPLLTCFFAWIFPLYVLTTLLYHVFQISKLNGITRCQRSALYPPLRAIFVLTVFSLPVSNKKRAELAKVLGAVAAFVDDFSSGCILK